MIALALALALGADAGVPTPARGAPLPPLDEVLKQTLAAHGGAAALSKITTVREKAHLVSAARGGQRATLLRLYSRPSQLRAETAFAGEPVELRLLDGRNGWRDGVPAPVGDLRHTAMALQVLRLQLPLLLDENRDRLVDGGLVSRGGKLLRAIVLPVVDGVTLTAELDPVTGRVARSIGQAQMPGGGQLEFITVFADYRWVNGVLFAFKEENYAQGQQTGDTVLDSVEVLSAAPAGSFSP